MQYLTHKAAALQDATKYVLICVPKLEVAGSWENFPGLGKKKGGEARRKINVLTP